MGQGSKECDPNPPSVESRCIQANDISQETSGSRGKRKKERQESEKSRERKRERDHPYVSSSSD